MKKTNNIIINNIINYRDNNSHKGTHGHALLITGSKGKMGAAVIAARACLRSGVGLLSVNVPDEERHILQTAVPEAMVENRSYSKKNITGYSAIGIGPGIGISKELVKLLKTILEECKQPLVLDADALNIISLHKKWIHVIPSLTIITPHPKEFDRLFGEHNTNDERIIKAIEKSKELDIIIVLKSNKTLITYNGESYLNSTGNAGLAKGGSGDALTGIITAFLAQGYSPFNAAILGVYIHGLAADIALKTQSMESMLITDVIECLGKAFKQIFKK